MTTTQVKQVQAVKPRLKFARDKANGTSALKLTNTDSDALAALKARMVLVRQA